MLQGQALPRCSSVWPVYSGYLINPCQFNKTLSKELPADFQEKVMEDRNHHEVGWLLSVCGGCGRKEHESTARGQGGWKMNTSAATVEACRVPALIPSGQGLVPSELKKQYAVTVRISHHGVTKEQRLLNDSKVELSVTQRFLCWI